MDSLELRDRPDVVFVKPANDLLFFMSSIPDATQAYLREKEMLHLSLDELAKRWKWTRDISPAMREHSGFFESIPAMQRAAGFYAGHVETYDESLTPYARFFSSEFLGFLADRGWGSLSFADLAHRYRYFSAFDPGVAAKKNDFEMIRRICLLQEVESSPLNIPMDDIVHHDAWGFSPETTAEISLILNNRGWEHLFDVLIMFGADLHPNFIFDYPDLIPHDRFFERVFHCVVEFLDAADQGQTQVPTGDWWGPRITAERKNISRIRPRHTEPRPISTKLLVSSIVVAQALAILAVLDATSHQPKLIYPGVIEDIRMRCAEVYAGISSMFD